MHKCQKKKKNAEPKIRTNIPETKEDKKIERNKEEEASGNSNSRGEEKKKKKKKNRHQGDSNPRPSAY